MMRLLWSVGNVIVQDYNSMKRCVRSGLLTESPPSLLNNYQFKHPSVTHIFPTVIPAEEMIYPG